MYILFTVKAVLINKNDLTVYNIQYEKFNNNENNEDIFGDANSVLIKNGPSNTNNIPKIIWSFWDSKDIPDFVQKCIDGWKKHNPDFEINDITRFIPLPSLFANVFIFTIKSSLL